MTVDLEGPLRYRSRRLIVALLGAVVEAEEAAEADLLEDLAGEQWKTRTVQNTLAELVGYGALRRAGRRRYRATPLGKAWLDGELPTL